MKKLGFAVAVIGLVLGASAVAHAGGVEQQPSNTRIDGIGRTVPASTNWASSSFSASASWPSHKAVNKQEEPGTRLDSLGKLVPTQTNWPTRFASETSTTQSAEASGAAGYSAPQSSEAHHPIAPFTLY